MLVIQREQLVKRLQEIADQQQRSVEDVVEAMINVQFPAPSAASDNGTYDSDEAVRRVRRKAYAKARKYWESVEDSEKASMTDEELDEQFAWFDEEGVPRLKSEVDFSAPPRPGSGRYLAMMLKQDGGFHSGIPDLAERSREVLDQHFAKDLLKEMRNDDAAE